MTNYEFQCPKCGNIFKEFCNNGNTKIKCPKCNTIAKRKARLLICYHCRKEIGKINKGKIQMGTILLCPKCQAKAHKKNSDHTVNYLKAMFGIMDK